MRHITLTLLPGVLACIAVGCATPSDRHGPIAQVVEIERFLPSHTEASPIPLAADEWQRALSATRPGEPSTVVFPRRDFLIQDVGGLRVPSNCTVVMYGARLWVDEAATTDGQVFLVEDAKNVTFLGGEIVGRRDAWDSGTNIAGIRAHGACDNLRVHDTAFRDLTSNAVGIFGTPERPIAGVSIENVTATNCCNYYGDYLHADSGPAPGSERTDQGAVALYHVTDWVVRECCLEASQSDGTHFYKSRHGRFVDNHVVASRMGGYFLEGCEYVIASGNLISENGSRGVTIERDSRHCTLTNTVIETSGREGLWAPDVEAIAVSNNVFRDNGRKDDGERDSEIRIEDTSQYATRTRDIVVRRNAFQSDEHQRSAIYITEAIPGLRIEDNAFKGAANPIYVASAETPAPK